MVYLLHKNDMQLCKLDLLIPPKNSDRFLILTCFHFLLLDECLRSHNELRRLHKDTPALDWDDRLAADAQKWSDHLANVKRGYHDYNRNDGSGESWWYWTWYDDSIVYSCADAVRAW